MRLFSTSPHLHLIQARWPSGRVSGVKPATRPSPVGQIRADCSAPIADCRDVAVGAGNWAVDPLVVPWRFPTNCHLTGQGEVSLSVPRAGPWIAAPRRHELDFLRMRPAHVHRASALPACPQVAKSDCQKGPGACAISSLEREPGGLSAGGSSETRPSIRC